MSWNRGRLVAFDVETTGVDPTTARIVTASVLVIPEDREQVAVHEWMIDPGVPIPDEAAAVHGVTTEKARADGVQPREALPGIVTELTAHNGAPLVVFNAAYDLTVLLYEWWRHFGSALEFEVPVVDPLVIDRHVDKYRPGKRTLQVMCENYGFSLDDEDAHTSSGDALAAARLAWKIAQCYEEVGSADLWVLHDLQKLWYREQSLGFARYLRGIADDKVSPEEASGLRERADGVNIFWPCQPLEVQSG
jgi:DNA polymerase-3 subunit epsilon